MLLDSVHKITYFKRNFNHKRYTLLYNIWMDLYNIMRISEL